MIEAPSGDPAAVTIRRAVLADADAMRDVARAAYGPYVARIGREPAPMTCDYAAIAEGGNTWVAEDAGRVVGLLVLSPCGGHLLLENVAVVPERQGTGLGTRLLRLAEDRARAAGLPEIRLYTNEAMTENLAYYPRHGYRRTHRAIEHGFRRVYFSKIITVGRRP